MTMEFEHVSVSNIWYRSLDTNGDLYCEARDPMDVLENVPEGGTLQKIVTYRATNGWEPWDGKTSIG